MDLIRWLVKREFRSLRWSKQRLTMSQAMIFEPWYLDFGWFLVGCRCQDRVCDYRQSLKETRQDKTTIIRAHRLNAVVVHTDLIFSSGKWSHYRTGVHTKTLLAMDGWYAQTTSLSSWNEREKKMQNKKNNGLYWSAWCPISKPYGLLTFWHSVFS